MLHIPAHKNVTHPPGQQVNKDKPVHEVKEQPPKPYIPPQPNKK